MRIHSLRLNNFRSFSEGTFEFKADRVLITGANAVGKSNLLEAIFLLSTGTSLKAFREAEMIRHGESQTTVEGEISDEGGYSKKLSIQVVSDFESSKRYRINDLRISAVNFVGELPCVHFDPADIGLVTGPPDNRRRYLDTLLAQTGKGYRQALRSYERARHQRNRLLKRIREGREKVASLEVWDEPLLNLAPVLQEERHILFEFFESRNPTPVFSYLPSAVSPERFLEYREREIGSAMTLIGPHRDDFRFLFREDGRDFSHFASRGQQRMAVFVLKMLEIDFLKETRQVQPVLLLDDVFSELDRDHRREVFRKLGGSQSIITTTEAEDASELFKKEFQVIKLS